MCEAKPFRKEVHVLALLYRAFLSRCSAFTFCPYLNPYSKSIAFRKVVSLNGKAGMSLICSSAVLSTKDTMVINVVTTLASGHDFS
jgi:hypothetical protein